MYKNPESKCPRITSEIPAAISNFHEGREENGDEGEISRFTDSSGEPGSPEIAGGFHSPSPHFIFHCLLFSVFSFLSPLRTPSITPKKKKKERNRSRFVVLYCERSTPFGCHLFLLTSPPVRFFLPRRSQNRIAQAFTAFPIDIIHIPFRGNLYDSSLSLPGDVWSTQTVFKRSSCGTDRPVRPRDGWTRREDVNRPSLPLMTSCGYWAVTLKMKGPVVLALGTE
ncbi:hypothetical protein CDAR_444131 [Caerostris darwini]|uniref:Uncharacterized protein n=1 Tax=Caerostris darwini TaxID=1538125 RepID=A0AAV4XBJ3_9ARAC|nr:hypothetical protein CDAR_444131 [Caerostris darwini]